MVLPRILYGLEVVGLRVTEVDSIQRQENAAMRRMLGASRGVAVAGRYERRYWPGSKAVSYTHLTLPTNREV